MGFGSHRLLSRQRYEPQDILMVFPSMQNGLMLPETDSRFVTLPDPNRTLLDFYQLFGDEILESQGNVGLGHNELNPDELEKIADHMLEEVLSTMPERDANIKFTRKWNEHYIRAVISGASPDRLGSELSESNFSLVHFEVWFIPNLILTETEG